MQRRRMRMREVGTYEEKTVASLFSSSCDEEEIRDAE